MDMQRRMVLLMVNEAARCIEEKVVAEPADADGAIDVDKFSKTSVPSIYAVGDVTGRTALTPVAIREGAAVAETLFNNNPVAVDHSLIGTAVFAEPEIGTIGLTEAEAATHGDADVYLTRFRPMMNTLSDKSDRMMLKLITLAEDQRVVGVHIWGRARPR